MGFRISRAAAGRILRTDDGIDAARPLELPSEEAARRLAARVRGEDGAGGLSAGRLTATVELAGILRRRLERYFESHPGVLDLLVEEVTRRLTRIGAASALQLFSAHFLGPADESLATAEPQADEAAMRPILIEFVLHWALSINPAATPVTAHLQEIPDADREEMAKLLEAVGEALAAAPSPDRRWPSLADSLRAPAAAAPDSLIDQIRFVLDEWHQLAASERAALVSDLDLISEEERPRFPPGPGPVELPDYDELEDEPPQFSPDHDWMETLVLIAKNTYVWLDQLSVASGCPVHRLDEIPDEALDRLADAGVTGLWLIGLWARSPASARIKQLMGNKEALASAYSLLEYEVADELGGLAAARDLAERAAARGIRLAADMVPNHMGIDSSWLIERPELFLSVRTCPFPSYTFTGPDLSSDPRVGIYLEDGYYDHSDAAVVFKRVDRSSGEARYVYHGNDGTSTPWNDTAQLDYLRAETREAVTEKILRVAGTFPIIRFDAAMTLARRHVQRLWYPEPGSGGAIPSRSAHGLSKRDFQRAMPTEFWRDVVDRAAAERPETLLLAEAFWLMEGYFVRTLGMHRVYNSAFMNLLREGETDKLRTMIRETLDFDPQILKRYVNFLSNPDEDSAVEQFGSGERYFGACVAMVTLPGLPMLAHGQLEGYREKYGMEFRRAQLGETPDPAVVDRHRREIVPLLRRRGQYAGVRHFSLLDLVAPQGYTNGNILAFANGSGTQRSITVFNNSPQRVIGRLTGGEILDEVERDTTYRMRDRTSELYYVAPATELGAGGLRVDLEPFESRVLIDFRPVLAALEDSYRELADRLAGRGVVSLEIELQVLELEGVLSALAELAGAIAGAKEPDSLGPTVERARTDLEEALAEYQDETRLDVLDTGLSVLEGLSCLGEAVAGLPWPESERLQDARRRSISGVSRGGDSLLAIAAVAAIAAVQGALPTRFEPELLERVLAELLTELPRAAGDPAGAESTRPDSTRPDSTHVDSKSLARVLALAVAEDWLSPVEPPGKRELWGLIRGWLERPNGSALLGLNRHDDEQWIRQENLELLLRWRGLTGLCAWLLEGSSDAEAQLSAIAWIESADLLRRLVAGRGFSVERVRERLGEATPAEPAAGAGSEAVVE